MAREVLSVPEEHLQEVIRVIRYGLNVAGTSISIETHEQLKKWCEEEEAYQRAICDHGQEDQHE